MDMAVLDYWLDLMISKVFSNLKVLFYRLYMSPMAVRWPSCTSHTCPHPSSASAREQKHLRWTVISDAEREISIFS